jgi:hypothetical protein
LHLVEEVFLEFLRSADIEDFMWNNGTFRELLTFLNEIAFEDDNVLVKRNEVFFL